jgi:hypothetical protein
MRPALLNLSFDLLQSSLLLPQVDGDGRAQGGNRDEELHAQNESQELPIERGSCVGVHESGTSTRFEEK